MKKLFAVIGVLFLLVMTSCSGGGGGSSSNAVNDSDIVASNIGSSGGSLTIPSGDAGLNVPAGALVETKSITISKSSKSIPPGNASGAYDYTPDGQTFSSPVTICIKYDPESIPEGMAPSDLRLARLSDNGEWETTGASTVDTTNHLVCGQTNHFSTYSVVVHERKNFGEKTGEFNSVIAYSNGTTEYSSNEYNTYGSYNTGMKWLCDEYVNRYYKQIYNKEIRIEGHSANDYYQNAVARGLTAYPNDGTEQLQTGDILISEYGEGHVAIVREVQDNKIFVIQQNWSDNGADDRYPVTRDGNHVYPFDGKKGNYKVKGWVRINDTATSTTTTSVTSTSTTTTSTSSSTSITITTTTTSTTTTTIAPIYSISGTVSGAVQSGVTITLTGTGSTFTTTDISGNYSFTEAANGNYTLTASLSGYTFSPPSINLTVNNADVIGKNFTSSGFIWTEHTTSGKNYWYALASSFDGTKLAAGAYYFGNIYTSTDTGNTWIERATAGTQNWNHISSSSNGTKLAAVGAGGGSYIYTSTDSGATWTQCTDLGTHNWGSIASSSDGTKLVAADYGGEQGGYIYTSTDSGSTWTEQTNPGKRCWSAISSSSDGTKMAATCKNTAEIGGTGYIYTSTNSGVTWTERTTSGLRDWRSIASSSDGTKLIAGENNGYIYTSTDSGTTWKQQTDLGIGGCWSNVGISSDGTILAAGDYWGYIYTSNDSGTTWTKQIAASNRYWSALAFSSDGKKLAAVPWDGYIWTAYYASY